MAETNAPAPAKRTHQRVYASMRDEIFFAVSDGDLATAEKIARSDPARGAKALEELLKLRGSKLAQDTQLKLFGLLAELAKPALGDGVVRMTKGRTLVKVPDSVPGAATAVGIRIQWGTDGRGTLELVQPSA